MADDGLSPAELETLLSAPRADRKHSGVTPAPSVAPSATVRASARPHDFTQPRTVTDDELCVLRALHERFARGFAVGLSSMLRCQVDAKLAGVEQLSYAQFASGLENPTCLCVLRAAPLAGELALDLRPGILFPILDRLLGGGRDPSPIARRPLTQIELRLTSRITDLALAQLRQAWRGVADLQLEVVRIESDPKCARIVLPPEGVVRVAVELAFQGARGVVSLCLPTSALVPIAGALASPPLAGSRGGASSRTVAEMSDNLRQSPVELVVHLAETRITAGDMLNLRAGDIITTTKDAREGLRVSVEGVAKFQALPGALKGRKAVQIDKPLGPETP